ncbi:MAG: sulfotransferase [Acidobacteriota bacterium]|nr:sulfotransferase [Acidobacteriota bacterium]
MYSRTQTPIFVISSGRAGSTMLARMINRHPSLICISDIFEPVGEEPYFDRDSVVDGKGFFAMLSRPSLPQRIDYWRDGPTDELLFLHPDDTMVSLLNSYTLPFLTGGDPTDLFVQMRGAVEGFGDDNPANHLAHSFDWLRECFGKKLWVERTGGSLPHIEKIIATWPEAKIVHNHRDCRETALSMMTGSFFRLYLELEKNPELEEWDWEHLPAIEEMGEMLNRWVVDAIPVLESLPDERRLDLSFDQFCYQPETTLLDLASFVLDRRPTEEDALWAREQATLVKAPRLRFPELSAGEQSLLEAACRPALDALGYN